MHLFCFLKQNLYNTYKLDIVLLGALQILIHLISVTPYKHVIISILWMRILKQQEVK